MVFTSPTNLHCSSFITSHLADVLSLFSSLRLIHYSPRYTLFLWFIAVHNVIELLNCYLDEVATWAGHFSRIVLKVRVVS